MQKIHKGRRGARPAGARRWAARSRLAGRHYEGPGGEGRKPASRRRTAVHQRVCVQMETVAGHAGRHRAVRRQPGQTRWMLLRLGLPPGGSCVLWMPGCGCSRGRQASRSTRNPAPSTTPWPRPRRGVLRRRPCRPRARCCPAPGRSPIALRGVPARVHHPARAARYVFQTAIAEGRATVAHSRCPPTRASPSSPSPTSRGAATTGTRGTTAASSRSTPSCRSTSIARSTSPATRATRASRLQRAAREAPRARARLGEYTVYPLFSPQSLIAEGTRELRHRGGVSRRRARRVRARVLFPLAGLDPSRAEVLRRAAGARASSPTRATRRRAAT